MALEDIFKALEHQAQRDVEDVLAEARARAAGLLAEAEVEAQSLRERHATDAETGARARVMQELNSARLEARRTLAGVRQGAVGDAFDEAREGLSSIRAEKTYGTLFEHLLDEALSGVEGEFEVLVDPRDEELARAALSARGIDAPVRPELSSNGGVVVALNGGRIFRRNTVEDRFEKYAGIGQAEVAEILFS
jgi:V/A-type H+-transporting ATPase subunit E